MKILPFMDIPVLDIGTPAYNSRRIDLSIWAEGDLVKFSAAFVCYDRDGSSEDDYMFQVGFIYQDCLVTTKEVIHETGDLVGHVTAKTDVEEYFKLLPRITQHLGLYFDKINSIPVWGTNNYYELKKEGRTVRTLEGPHKASRLRPGEMREVIIDRKGEFAYGPKLPIPKGLKI